MTYKNPASSVREAGDEELVEDFQQLKERWRTEPESGALHAADNIISTELQDRGILPPSRLDVLHQHIDLYRTLKEHMHFEEARRIHKLVYEAMEHYALQTYQRGVRVGANIGEQPPMTPVLREEKLTTTTDRNQHERSTPEPHP